MNRRVDYSAVAPDGIAALRGLEAYVRGSELGATLLELVRTRASQMNGCAYCIDMHTKDARANGETEQRLYALPAWRETSFFSPRERAALQWTEALTRIAEHGAIDSFELDAARAQFNDKELVDLTLAVVAINGWNRLAVAFGSIPGSYQPAKARAAT